MAIAIDHHFVKKLRFEEPVYVTRPTMPALNDYVGLLKDIWAQRQLTNAGRFHNELETRLAKYLGVNHLSLFCNGTQALLVALKALQIDSGEVITTPFTFPATVHVLPWNNIRPVFCDVNPNSFCLDPSRLEELIGPETKAILPVHVYGNPCEVETIRQIAERHGLRVIYDAAHAFGVKYKGLPLAAYGDMSMLSFHATKLFSTIEGGALVVGSAAQKEQVNLLKNFGFKNEEIVIGPGINGKMNEFQAAYGLLELDLVGDEIRKRGRLVKIYRDLLRDIPGIHCTADLEDVEHNYAYCPILVDTEGYGLSRDQLYDAFKELNVFTRKYFYPLISRHACYAALPSANPRRLPVAERVSNQVLCLPLYGSLPEESVRRICGILRELPQHAAGALTTRQ